MTPQGKKVHSGDARLHLEKLKAKRLAVENKEQLNREAIKSELDALDRERRRIEFQMKQRREAEKWEEEFAKKKDEHVASSEYPTEDPPFEVQRIVNALEGRIRLARIARSDARRKHLQMICRSVRN